MALPIPYHRRLAGSAEFAAKALAGMDEWHPAGHMLRVAALMADDMPARVALTYARCARLGCTTESGSGVCAIVIRDLEAIEERQPRPDGEAA